MWNNERMDLNEASIFAKVVESGSFSAAGRALDLPKSTVSRKVAALEARLDVRLLHRTTRRMGLTDAGRAYHAHALRAVEELQAAERAVASLDDVPRGRLRVSAPPNLPFLAPICAAFLRAHPGVQLELDCGDRRVDLVEEGWDLALRAGRLEDSSLVARRIATWTGLLVASPRYLRTHGTPREPDELEQHHGLFFGRVDRWTLVRSRRKARVSPLPRLVTNDLETIEAAAADGQGVALLPQFRCAAQLDAKRLRRVLPQWSGPSIPLHAVYPTRRHLPARVRAFVDILGRELTHTPWSHS